MSPQAPSPRKKPSPSAPSTGPADRAQSLPLKAPAPVRADAGRTPDGLALILPVEPRKPRLAWHGWDRREAVVSVPTQIVEIVRPGRSLAREGELPGLGVRRTSSPPKSGNGKTEIRKASSRPPSGIPENRLIWTNDNIVALQTLLDERDPATRGYRYRGKVDLIYIDPPFMVNNDFRADNSIDIGLDDDEGVQAKKEPSLVEILAYKDTWRQGLDTFLSMMRSRLVLLKEFLAPTGSIYVHLDWHAVHYVKILLDEIFGYENLVNEIIWQRQTSHNDLGQGAKHLGRVHDTILVYRAGPDPLVNAVYTPYDASYVRSHYGQVDARGRRFQLDNLIGPGGAAKGNPFYEVMGHKRFWRFKEERMRQLIAEGRVVQSTAGSVPRYKRYLDDMPGIPIQDVWADVNPINSQAREAMGYPTQKPISLLERIIKLSSPPGGLVLDCFAGSGTTAEAAERLGRRFVVIDNGKYAVHLTRKRLIQLHDTPKSVDASQVEYVECGECRSVSRKEKSQKLREHFKVRAFTVENMGVYQRAEQWQDFQTERTRYRDEMIKIFGGEPLNHSALLHGRKGNAWIHVGPLDGPVSPSQVWSIAREAKGTERRNVTILSADYNPLSGGEKEDIQKSTGVAITIRIIPASAIDEVRRRLEIQRSNRSSAIESMAIPAFYAPLSIVLRKQVSGRIVRITLERCDVDIESFIASQKPLLKPITTNMSAAALKKAKAEIEKWEAREAELQKWLSKAASWQKFVDFWAIDWDYGRRVGEDEKPIFETDWQSFRVRRSKNDVDPIRLTAEFQYEQAGQFRVAARVTDVFGNDGIATVNVEVR